MSVLLEKSGAVATITLSRPQVKNALGPPEWQALAAHIGAVERDRDVRVLLISGAGGTFSAGGDLATMPERIAEERELRRQNLRHDFQVIAQLRALPHPVVAVIEGAAVGAGLALALACDVRLATTTARLGAGFHRVGLTGDFGLLWHLPRIVGPTRATEILFGGELIDGKRAEELGLVTRAVEPAALPELVESWKTRLADGPPIAMAHTKRGLQCALEYDLGDLLDFEAEAQADCSQTQDVREGLAAYREKRPPRFKGR